MESNHKALARFTRSNRVLTALEIESAEKIASGFMMIPPPSRCRLGQGLNLQLPSFDGRVFRSNRTLTATERFSGRKSDKEQTEVCLSQSAETPAPLEPFRCAVLTVHWRSFSHPLLPKGTGTDGGGSSLIFTAQKEKPGDGAQRRWGRRRRSPQDRVARQNRSRYVNVLYH